MANWTTTCPICFASHGCDLPPGHDGNHKCMKWDEESGEMTGEVCFEWEPGHQYEFDVNAK